MQSRAKITVIKADGTAEDYFHTKVLAAINNCMTAAGHCDILLAEEFAQVITYHLHKEKIRSIRSEQIPALIKEVLCSTGFEDAAEALASHQLTRAVRRSRLEVVSDGSEDNHKDEVYKDEQHTKERWNKSRILRDLVDKAGLERQLARTIASAVEEKVLSLQLRKVSTKLIKQLVLAETEAMLCAKEQLQSA